METNGKPVPTRSAKSVEKLVNPDQVDLRQCDWSRINQEPSHDEMVEIIEMMRQGENPALVEQEYLEMIKNRDQLSSLTDLLKDLEAGTDARTP